MKNGWHWPGMPFKLPYRVLSTERLFLRFDGPELKGHTMDVALFGPSITALGELCSEANYKLNGERSKVRVLINADIKGNCVTVTLQVVQHIWTAAKEMISNKDIESAKVILEWIGLLSPLPGAASLMQFLIKKRDRGIESSKVVKTNNGNHVEIKIVGDNNTIILSESVFSLAQEPKIIEAAKKLVSPVNKENGITEATFYQNDQEQTKISQEDAAAIQSATVAEKVTEETFTAHLVVYAPVLDAKVKKWRFLMNGDHPYMDISSTTIASDTLKRGGVRTGDSYTAEVKKTVRPGKDPEYKIVKLIDFRSGQNLSQGDLF